VEFVVPRAGLGRYVELWTQNFVSDIADSRSVATVLLAVKATCFASMDARHPRSALLLGAA